MLIVADRPGTSRSLAPPGPLSGERLQWMCFWLPVVATLYSAVMALVIARGGPGGYGLVVACEVGLLGLAGIVILASGLTEADWAALLMCYLLVVIAVILSMVNNRPMIETLRATFLILLFAMIGQRTRLATLDRIFLVVSLAVLGVLLMEIFAQTAYVSTFHPSAFYAATRGIQQAEYNNTGLFNTATSYESRFSFGFFDVPRTSSIFMEQVSNANFACILAIYVSARWSDLSWLRRLLLMGTVALVLVSTNGRFASLLVLSTILGYFVFPLFGRVLMPLASLGIGAIAIGINLLYTYEGTDDLIGRITFAGKMFGEADLPFYLGARASFALAQRDSGYTYVIGSLTIFGALALWAFINFYPRANDAPSRRVAWGTIGYMLGQLLVSSTSLFSVKTATLLWVLVGCMRMQPQVVSALTADDA